MNDLLKRITRRVPNLIFTMLLFSGIFQSNLDAQTIIRVNRTWCGMLENGGTGAFNYAGGWFPNDYNAMGSSMENGDGLTGSSISTGCTNWTDPDGILRAKGVTQTEDGYVVAVTSPLTSYIRWGYPASIIDLEDITLTDWATVSSANLEGTSDQTAEATYVNAMGVEVKRKVFAWSQQYHDSYIVVDVVLTNLSGTTLENFYTQIDLAPYYMRKAKGSDPIIPGDDRLGVNRNACWHHYYGARPGDSLRIHYMYHADDPTTPGDQMGGPVKLQDGRLTESDIMYYAILHASAAPYTDPADDVDDPLQPRVTSVYAEPVMGVEAKWKTKWTPDGDNYDRDLIYDLMAGKHGIEQPMDGQIAGTFHRANNDEQNDPDYTNLGEGFSLSAVWNSSYSSFGPYTFEDGQSIHIVYVGGYTGIGIKKEKEIGEKWKAGTLEEPPNLPNATTGYFPDEFAFPTEATDMDKVKDRWISTGIDSVHQAVSRAKFNFENDWQVPGSPAPPEIELTGTGLGTEIKWSSLEAEADPNFAGYRILKRRGERDTTFFEMVYETSADDIATEHTFLDSTVLFGALYYYYVQACKLIPENDLTAHPDSRGKKIYSGRIWMPTYSPVTPRRPFQNDLSKIRIVPNPYNIKDDLLDGYQFLVERQGIQFFNLPAKAKIRIYTESGDLVRTIEHTPDIAHGHVNWDLLTENQQVVASGIYIAVFENAKGESAYQKFIVVR